MYNAHVPRDRDAHGDTTSRGRGSRPLRAGMSAIRKMSGFALIAVMLAVALLLAACGGGEDARETVHGILTDVQTRTFTEIESFSLIDEAGETWLFVTEGQLELTPSHLRQHMLGGDEVRVEYERPGRGASRGEHLRLPLRLGPW